MNLRTILMLCLAFFTTLACDKDDEPAPLNKQIIGTWQLQQITGGLTGHGYDAEFETLTIEENDIYTLTDSLNNTFSGTYALTFSDTEPSLFRITEPSDSVLIFEMVAEKNLSLEQIDSLFLTDECCDNFGYRFIRVE
ncbi:MAG: hypothetical protein MRY78_20960 [Saprospiraceae bacterium]|nr:hypothetical protein [Saprospiraceae bacterium]